MRHLARCGRLASLLSAAAMLACTGEIAEPGQPQGPGQPGVPGQQPGQPGDPGQPGTPGDTTTTGGPAVVQDGGEGSGEAVTGSACADVGVDTGPSVLRRLTRTEYRLTLQDLLQLSEAPTLEAIPTDVAQDGFTAYSELHNLSSVLLRGYLEVAKEQAALLLADATRRELVIGCDLNQANCLQDFVTRFGELAYRRPLDAGEVSSVVTRAEQVALDSEDRFRFALEVLLTSPNFLYRVELGDAPDGLSTLTAREVASRLSFATWGRAPSPELLALADQGALDTPEGLKQVASEMLVDPRAQLFFTTFFREWLNYDEMRAPSEPPADWNEGLMPALQQETDDFLAAFAWSPGSDFLGAFTANHSYMTPELASFYGLPAPGIDGRVEFPAGHPRENTGLLGHASVLSAKSDGDSVALRGNWLRSTFLCEELYIDAAELDAIGEELVGLTRMQIIAERNTRAACAGCHSAIDPIGVGFEQFDATGRFDPGVDLSTYPIAPAFPDADDPSFESVPQLAQKLAAMPELAACLSGRVFLYAHGRDPIQPDSCAIEQATTEFIQNQHGFSSLLLGLIEAPAFRLRRPPTL